MPQDKPDAARQVLAHGDELLKDLKRDLKALDEGGPRVAPRLDPLASSISYVLVEARDVPVQVSLIVAGVARLYLAALLETRPDALFQEWDDDHPVSWLISLNECACHRVLPIVESARVSGSWAAPGVARNLRSTEAEWAHEEGAVFFTIWPIHSSTNPVETSFCPPLGLDELESKVADLRLTIGLEQQLQFGKELMTATGRVVVETLEAIGDYLRLQLRSHAGLLL